MIMYCLSYLHIGILGIYSFPEHELFLIVDIEHRVL